MTNKNDPTQVLARIFLMIVGVACVGLIVLLAARI